jgi:hypothetical protein
VNRSGLNRFSAEWRTVDARDFVAGRGAPNVDGLAPRVPLEWWRPVEPAQPRLADL